VLLSPVDHRGEIAIMRGCHFADPRRILLGVMIGCLCAAVGCGPGGGSSGPIAPEKTEQIRKVTSDYMKNMRKAREQEGPRGKR
jgi:hypothetical protein